MPAWAHCVDWVSSIYAPVNPWHPNFESEFFSVMSESTHPISGVTRYREDAHLFPEISSHLDDSAYSLPEMSGHLDDSTHLVPPEISSHIDQSAHSFPEMSRSVNESDQLFPGMNTRLYRAAEEGNVHAFNDLIAAEGDNADAPIDVNETKDRVNIFQQFTGTGNSALHIAVSCGKLRFITRLLEEINKDLDVGREFLKAKNSDGNNALHIAAFRGHRQLVERLIELMNGDLETGDFLKFQNNEGNTALHEAAKGENYKVVNVLLKHCSPHDLINVSNAAGETALFIASQIGHERIVRRLLSSSDSNNNMQRHDGQTPLHAAVFYGRQGVVKRLLRCRPDLAKKTDASGRTALHMLVFLFPAMRNWWFLWRYRAHDYNKQRFIKTAILLLENDNSLCYKQDNKGKTPLHMAVEWARFDLVNILLEYGRDCIEVVDHEGRKPLHLAVINAVRLNRTSHFIEFSNLKNMLLSLMSKGSVNHRDSRKRTPLHIAVEGLEKDAALYNSIIALLRTRGALLTPEILEDKRRVRNLPLKLRFRAETVSINAVLIATVSFAAAFALPGGLDSQHESVFINAVLFRLFLICDTFSFCSSIASAIIVQYAGTDEDLDRPQVLTSTRFLWLALISLLVAFGAAVHLVIEPSPWLAGSVWSMVCFVPIAIWTVRFRSRGYIYLQERRKILVALRSQSFGIGMVILIIWDTFKVFLFAGVLHNTARGIKKLLKWRRQRSAL